MTKGPWGAALALCLAFVPNGASADVGAVSPEVVEKVRAVEAATGAERYAALRTLWRTWDRVDPGEVEEAVLAAAASPTLDPPTRVYAELLASYARRRRGDLEGSAARLQKLGFVGGFLTVGPFDNENKGGFPFAFGPENELASALVLGRSYDGKERPVRYRAPPGGSSYGWFDFGDFLRPREEICGYATTFVSAKAGTKTPRPLSLWMGSTGAFKLFWDDALVLQDSAYRQLDIDRFATTVTLSPGPHRITVKVCGTDESPKFALRLGDARGAPELGVELSTDPAKSDEVARAISARKAEKTDKTAAKSELAGPLQRLSARAEAKDAKPADLEAYARYLAATGGDPDSEHTARDLARRAAEGEPTVARLLFAGSLAEDRNQRAEWLEKARALATEERVDVLLAEARHARSGTNWRDAVPIYRRILALEPDNVDGTLGLVELYGEAGLRRTALATIERAVERRPTTIALLRTFAGELRAAGRDTEAVEVEARYVGLRFDDTGYLAEQVDLAVARRDSDGARRWLTRLLQTDPDSTWSRGVAARTYRALGEPARAIATYQEALQMAPEDLGSLRALSDLFGERGERAEQLALLRKILSLSPQAKDVRDYVDFIEPKEPRADERYAWAPERFLPLRDQPSPGYPRRTLRQLTVSTVYPNGLSSKFRQIVYQPLTDEGAASAREYAFTYEADRQLVELRAAKVYRKSGRVDEAIESGEGPADNPAIAMYTSQRTVYVHFPRLEPGDIVELRYRIEDVAARNEVGDYFGELEYMQSGEPVAGAEYVVVAPKSRTLYTSVTHLPGAKTETREDGDKRIFRVTADSIAPVAAEPWMPPWAEVLGRVHVSTFASWQEVGAYYWGLSRDQLDVDDELRAKIRELTKDKATPREKVEAVYAYVTRLRYVALELGIEGIRPRRAAQTIARGWGDCKDKATVIVTMLRELGIPATVVLVRTGLRGQSEDQPASLAPFDHAIAYVPSLDLYLDGTAEHTGTRELPMFDRGAFGLQVNEGKPQLVRLPHPPAEESVSARKVEATLAGDGSAQVAVERTISGVLAAEWRARYIAEGTRRERATRDLASDFGSVDLAPGKPGLELGDLDDVERPVHFKARGKATTFARKEADSLSAPTGPASSLVAELTPLAKRVQDLVIPALSVRDDDWSLSAPAGMKVVAAPAPQKLDTPFGSFSISVERSASRVTVKSRLAFAKTRIPPAEYEAFRAFCQAADRAFGQRVVFGK
jgi:tetratricopeptide (TPR) repeat protein